MKKGPAALSPRRRSSSDSGGSATTSGTITVTLQWIQDPTVPNDTAPPTLKLVESASASWSAEGGGPDSAFSGSSKSVGIDGTVIYEFQDDYNGAISKSQLVEVDSSSGTVTRQCSVSASSICNGAPGDPADPVYGATLRVHVSYGVSIHATPYKFRQTSVTDNGNGTLTFTYDWESTTGNIGDLTSCYWHERVTYPGGDPYYPPRPFYVALGIKNPTVLPGTEDQGGQMSSTYAQDDVDAYPVITPYSFQEVSSYQRWEYDDMVTGERDVLIPSDELSTFTVTRKVRDDGPSPGWWYSVEKNNSTAWKQL